LGMERNGSGDHPLPIPGRIRCISRVPSVPDLLRISTFDRHARAHRGAYGLLVVVGGPAGVFGLAIRGWRRDPQSPKVAQEGFGWLKRAIAWIIAVYVGKSPEPRAWDFYFATHKLGIVRLHLMNDEWKAGKWADDSFASQYGEEGDLYVADQYFVDEDGFPVAG
jgi:hypothetical protein